MSPISSLALVTIRSSIASPLVGLSITWLKKLSSMHFRSLLDCLQLAMLLFQQMSGTRQSIETHNNPSSPPLKENNLLGSNIILFKGKTMNVSFHQGRNDDISKRTLEK
ncbi:hypothetical protein QYF61_002534, partial [Mycteria americana]